MVREAVKSRFKSWLSWSLVISGKVLSLSECVFSSVGLGSCSIDLTVVMDSGSR